MKRHGNSHAYTLLYIYTHTHTSHLHTHTLLIMMNMESWKPKVMTKSKLANAPNCKKHPKHTQSPGVCSICLCEKLSQLSICGESSPSSSKGARSVHSSSSSSSVSSLTSSEASSCASPYTWRVGMEGRNSMRPVFMKSRSMAFVSQNDHEKKINNGGFWSKLLPNRKLMHSTTMQLGRVMTAVH